MIGMVAKIIIIKTQRIYDTNEKKTEKNDLLLIRNQLVSIHVSADWRPAQDELLIIIMC